MRASLLALGALGAALLLLTSAARLNAGYLMPGVGLKLDRDALNQSRFCALTFDDGPDSTYTMQVARILDKHGVKATFFVVGSRVRSYPEQVRTLAAAGHAVENHSWSHPDFTKIADARKREEIVNTTAELQRLGITPRYFRPPYGAFDSATLRACRDCGLAPMLWSVDPKDWAKPGSDAIVKRVLSGSRSGAVILLHSTNAETVEALPTILTRLKAEGYTFVTMGEWEQLARGKALLAPGDPPSLREIKPGEAQPLPEAPSLPAPPLGQLAAADDAAHAPAETPLLAQTADPAWVDSLEDVFVPESGAGAETAVAGDTTESMLLAQADSGAAPEIEPAGPPWPSRLGSAAHASVVHSAWRLLGGSSAAAAPAYVQSAPGPPRDPLPELRVYGNFSHPDEAGQMHRSRRSGPVRRVR